MRNAAKPTPAVVLRQEFKSLPSDHRNSNQPFSIRIWRALSWLERAESMPSDDYEGRFISAWIGFNALYGRLDPDQRPWGEREAWNAFLGKLWGLDHDEAIRRVLGKRQLHVLKLIENKFLTVEYWLEAGKAERHAKQQVRDALNRFGTRRMLPVFQSLFGRLYVMRVQVFHGASTKGSSLNRRALQSSGSILLDLLPVMIKIMIDRGIHEDWGDVCFAPKT